MYGIPDELFYIPEVQGLFPTKSTWCIVPTKPLTIYYTKTTSTQRLKATPAMSIKKTLTCRQYTSPKPPIVPPEFIHFVNIIRTENGWLHPTDCQEALELYLHLISEFDDV